MVLLPHHTCTHLSSNTFGKRNMSGSDGERGRNRTFNLLIKSQFLCQLSYAPFSIGSKKRGFQRRLYQCNTRRRAGVPVTPTRVSAGFSRARESAFSGEFHGLPRELVLRRFAEFVVVLLNLISVGG